MSMGSCQAYHSIKQLADDLAPFEEQVVPFLLQEQLQGSPHKPCLRAITSSVLGRQHEQPYRSSTAACSSHWQGVSLRVSWRPTTSQHS